MRTKHPTAEDAMRVARAKFQVEDPMLRVVRQFEKSIAEDTAYNEYVLHVQIHRWLAVEDSELNVDQFNTRVYAQLFKTPEDDKWMGFGDPTHYTALPARGLSRAQ